MLDPQHHDGISSPGSRDTYLNRCEVLSVLESLVTSFGEKRFNIFNGLIVQQEPVSCFLQSEVFIGAFKRWKVKRERESTEENRSTNTDLVK